MNTQADKFWYRLVIAAVAVILSSSAGVAAIRSWFPASTENPGDTLAHDDPPVALAKPLAAAGRANLMQPGGAARGKGRCAECGVIVSMREIKRHDDPGPEPAGGVTADNQDEARVKSETTQEIIVRMADGSSRVINHASPATWRPGERVIVIDGANPSNR